MTTPPPPRRDVAGIDDRLGAGYDRLSRVLDRTAVNRMRGELLARAHGDVLEVAVGTGVDLRRYRPGVRVTGLDFSAGALEVAALGCHPDRDTVGAIEAAGFSTVVLDRALRGLFLAVEATP